MTMKHTAKVADDRNPLHNCLVYETIEQQSVTVIGINDVSFCRTMNVRHSGDCAPSNVKRINESSIYGMDSPLKRIMRFYNAPIVKFATHSVVISSFLYINLHI